MLRRVFITLAALLLASTALAQMYATTGGGGAGSRSVFLMDESTGAVTFLAQPNFGGAAAPINLGMPGLDFTSDGRLFVVTGEYEGPPEKQPIFNNHLARLDPVTGEMIELIGELGDPNDPNAPSDIRDIAIHPGTDAIYATTYNGILYTIDSSTAVVTEVGGTGVYGPIAFAADGTLYMAEMNCRDEPPALYTVSTATGGLTFVANLNRYYIALGMGPDLMLYGADMAGNEQFGGCGGTWGDIYRIDPGTGQETFLGGNTGHVIHDIAFVPEQAQMIIPTLSGWGLALLVACLGLLAWRRLAG